MGDKQEDETSCPYGLDSTSERMNQSNDELNEIMSDAHITGIVNFIKSKSFKKDDKGKLRYGLIPPLAEREMVDVLTFGAQKYSVDNWRNVDDLSRYVDAALRHISAYRMGQWSDEETGLHHLAHAMCCLSFIVDIEIGALMHRDDPIVGKEQIISLCDGCAYAGITHEGCFECVERSHFKKLEEGL
ncbi:dATP/dGTP diphosphohydrolase domain-containing protein [Sulfuricurvum sp.]|uniref:dATP/dGTP diphosphohydrolase domain-containing protein n=1 Tax=Sulfuricurvum sp. TaxID=2025608 RepID=UPI00260BA27B|nr:dATP/dGTP diphosphohydrolase domain-containing protein [Sulfuricurvum sp.]MDD2267487.1 DUF5664 domain-containing protein [Sulfuricurvum sp.]MDD2783965.1 DUF5664 domain-containing protein [Sulfuricurvum sp.]